jgi:transcription-repair coupling factor (superfamily II helicase)
VKIEMISRFKTKQEQKTIVSQLAGGQVTSSSARTGCCRRT